MASRKIHYTYNEYVWLSINVATMEELETLTECLDADKDKFHPGIVMEIADLIQEKNQSLNPNHE